MKFKRLLLLLWRQKVVMMRPRRSSCRPSNREVAESPSRAIRRRNTRRTITADHYPLLLLLLLSDFVRRPRRRPVPIRVRDRVRVRGKGKGKGA